MPLYLGIDFGTSGARAIAINHAAQIQAQASYALNADQQTATHWQTALFALLDQLPLEVRQQIQAIAINGTSSTVLWCDDDGNPLDDPILYNDARGTAVMDQVRAIAPPDHTVLSPTSSLAKVLWWLTHPPANTHPNQLPRLLHQADWLAYLLHGKPGISDYHNALKLGYDVGELRYPDWMQAIASRVQLPQVVEPGRVIAPITGAIAQQFQLPTTCQVCAGTTDSIAAFLASGADEPGMAVTSLGSTLVLKLLSQTRVDAAEYGIYSHRLGDLWLVGGASNTGGAVLKQFFSTADLDRLSATINPHQPSGLDYYPLLRPGERFPINDATLQPRLDPKPDNPADFLHGLLESMARIEALGYQRLQELGTTPLEKVYTAGGGAKNTCWMEMRSRLLNVEVERSPHTEAAYGTALLAMRDP